MIVIERVESVVPLARALVAGGIRVLEVTLRTPVALDAVRAIRAAVPEALVGVGTVTTTAELDAAIAAGAASRPGLACRPAWPSEPGSTQGHVGHRAVPYGRTRWTPCCAAMAAARISSPTTPVGTAIARSARAARPSAGSMQEDAASRSEQARTCAMPAIVCGPATTGDGGSESGLPPLGVGIRRRTTNEPHLHVVKRIELSWLNEQRSVSSAKACQCFAKVDALSPN